MRRFCVLAFCGAKYKRAIKNNSKPLHVKKVRRFFYNIKLLIKDEKVFMQQLRALVKEEVAAAMNEYTKPVEPVEEFISSKELCSALKISKQTLYNWLKHANTKPLIEANRQKVGNKVGYNITGIKAAIKNNPLLFGNGRDYEFKMEVVMTAAQKAVRRFKGISSKIFFSEMVSAEDSIFLLLFTLI